MNKEFKIRNEGAERLMTGVCAVCIGLRAEGRAPGVEVLLSGINELLSGENKYFRSTKELSLGENELFPGIKQLLRSGKQLFPGVNELLRSGKQLFSLVKQLLQSGKLLFRGVKQLFRSENELSPGENELSLKPISLFSISFRRLKPTAIEKQNFNSFSNIPLSVPQPLPSSTPFRGQGVVGQTGFVNRKSGLEEGMKSEEKSRKQFNKKLLTITNFNKKGSVKK
ncbi:MAG: hypothetical protein H6536_00040 [Bacteroidales bacterium]|nr:hypothetical protein [Bacteroidales bacterium]